MKKLHDILIFVEDKRFYSHCGIDIRAIARAFIVNVKACKYVQGGSTITQQLARTLYLNNDKTISRKLKEIFIALYLESKYSKREILDLYMENVYMGQDKKGISITGFEAASHYYFNLPLDQLLEIQNVRLVAMLRGPNIYHPYTAKGNVRTNKILQALDK